MLLNVPSNILAFFWFLLSLIAFYRAQLLFDEIINLTNNETIIVFQFAAFISATCVSLKAQLSAIEGDKRVHIVSFLFSPELYLTVPVVPVRTPDKTCK